MKQLIALTSAAFAATATFAAPVVSDVTMTQDASKTVNITYKLKGEPGIVTVDIQTNGPNGWVSIGGEHLTYFAGDANKVVQPTGENETRKITWKPRKAWPDNEVTENVKAVLSAWALNAPPDYMVVSLVTPGDVRYYTCAENVPFGVVNELYKTECLAMRKIPAANVQWRMGSPTTENGRVANRESPHLVTLTEDYYMGVYPVTQRQYELLMRTDPAETDLTKASAGRPSDFKLEADYATRPVEKVSYEILRGEKANYNWPNNGHDVKEDGFIGKLRKLSGLDGFDLPTEAQWEFACRAGCGAALYNGKELENVTTSANVAPLARYRNNGGFMNGKSPTPATCPASNGTAKVGSYERNAWGLYDMLGNVSEWCLDWYQDSISTVDAAKGPTSGSNRVIRGGNWYNTANDIRSAARNSTGPTSNGSNIGFRLYCPAAMQ